MKYLLHGLTLLLFQVSFSQKDTIIDFGEKLINENRLTEAISYYNKSLIQSKNDEQQIYLLLGLAEAYKLKLDYDEASVYFLKSYDLIKQTKNPQLEFLYRVKMAEFFRKRTLFLDANEQLIKAEKLLKLHPIDDTNLANFYSRKAALFTEYFFKVDSTFFYANKALELSKKVGDKQGYFYASLEISGVYEEKKEYDKAVEFLEELLDYAKENRLIQEQADAYINYTRVLFKSNQFEKGLKECEEALDFAKINDLFYGEILFTDNIRNFYDKLGNIDKAYEYLEIRLKLTDKYYQIEHGKFLFELEEKYKLTEKENQIKINNLKIVNQNKALASNKIKLYVSLVFILIATVLVFFIAHVLKRTKINNRKLELLSQENEFLLSEANHRINNNLQLVIILIADQLKKSIGSENFQLKNILTKVETISTLHKHLYRNKDKKIIDASKYLSDVKVSFFDTFNDNNIHISFKVAPVDIPSDFAMYLGLLLTELFINSIKHAFVKQDFKEITFDLYEKDNILYFNYSDNGDAILNAKIKPKLIDKLCRQLKIKYHIETENGFSFSFIKPISND
ncbi:tetratricopeptide repeat-containing sensor histidine kinase [Bizionia argentinensis]|nr:sensor histidine kinase [Bizionia argentinensis]